MWHPQREGETQSNVNGTHYEFASVTQQQVLSHKHVHDFTDVEDNDYTHGRPCGIPGIVRNYLTAQTASSRRWAVL